MLLNLNKLTTKNFVVGMGIVAATTLASGTAMAAQSITPSTADYNLIAESKYKGTATRSLTKSGDIWQHKVDAKAAGVATANQRSTFKLVDNTIIPISASTSYKVLGIGRTHNLKFSEGGKKVASTYRGKTYQLSSPNIALDDLSIETQIRQDLLKGKFTGNYYMAKKDKIERTPFKKVGHYKITVPAGTFDTVRVDRIHDSNKRSTQFWFAPSLDYLPVKITQINDGKISDLELTKVH